MPPTRKPDPGNPRALGDAFRRHRTAACLTQQQVAAKSGMSQKKYSRIEGGEIQDPGLSDVVSIGRVFGLTPDTLAELAGLWSRVATRAPLDERWSAIVAFMEQAPESQRARFLDLCYGLLLGMTHQAPRRFGIKTTAVPVP